MNKVQKYNVLIVQEIVPEYRLALFNELNEVVNGEVTVLSDAAPKSFGTSDLEKQSFKFKPAKWKTFGRLFKNSKTFYSMRNKYDVIFHVADFKFLTLWFAILTNPFCKSKLFLHGQGGYKSHSLISNFIYFLALKLADGYICYTDFSAHRLKLKVSAKLADKISVCENTLSISASPITINKYSDAIFYIGRLREGCDVELLLAASYSANVYVHVIGGGDHKYIRKLNIEYAETLIYHGPIFDYLAQIQIANKCFAGAYGGDAGLSVVHYMSLGLPIIVHDNLGKHMGPEPSYVENEVSGLMFKRKNLDSLADAITRLKNDLDLRERLSKGSLDKFYELSQPSMAIKLASIMGLSN